MAQRAIETTGTVDEEHHLVLDEPLPIAGPSRVKVITLLPEDADLDEKLWLQTARSNAAFEFLTDPAEDIYTLD